MVQEHVRAHCPAVMRHRRESSAREREHVNVSGQSKEAYEHEGPRQSTGAYEYEHEGPRQS